MKNKFNEEKILSEEFVLLLHKKMFSKVWKWAGRKRTSNKNIGVDKYQISVELKVLLDDCKFWIENHTYEPDEIAIRFSHRLVQIHVFPNGNGRHSRLIADIIISNLFNGAVFTWGRMNLAQKGEARKNYMNSIYDADKGMLRALIDFART